jgi:hypothetical protein
MFKKTLVLSMAVVLILMGLCSLAAAAQNVANTSQKGSLLVFPAIGVHKAGTDFVLDTIITIGNDNSAGTTIKCLWMDAAQNVWDFEFPITANQPVWFRASDGVGSISVNPFGFGDGGLNKGELKCFAISFPVDEGAPEQQIAWNHLYGSAIVVDFYYGTAAEYPAWAFTARGNVATGSVVGTTGQMVLNGGGTGTYDACPAYLIYNFFADTYVEPGISPLGPELFLSPCYQDLRQDRIPTCTKAKFDVWNENERKLTGAYRCVKCWCEGALDYLDNFADPPFQNLPDPTKPFDPDKNHPKAAGFGGENFRYSSIHTTTARFRVTGISGSTVCAGVFTTIDPLTGKLVDLCPASKQVAVPFLGLSYTTIEFGLDSALGPPQKARQADLVSTGATAGVWVPTGSNPVPTILWDTADGPQQAPGK